MSFENERQMLFKIVANVFGLPIAEVNEELSMKNTVAWDSFNHLMLISEVEKALHVKFSMAEMQGIKTLRAIIDKIRDYGTT